MNKHRAMRRILAGALILLLQLALWPMSAAALLPAVTADIRLTQNDLAGYEQNDLYYLNASTATTDITITIDSDLVLQYPLVIQGNTAFNITIVGNNHTIKPASSTQIRLMEVSKVATLTISNLTLQGGNTNLSNGGGALYVDNASKLDVTNCDFIDNEAPKGGAVAVSCSAAFTGCAFSGNKATNTSGSGNGGAIHASGDLTLTGCTFTNNSAGNSGGAVQMNSDVLSVAGCTFTGNSSEGGAGTIYCQSISSLTNTLFQGNEAKSGAGGAIFVNSVNGIVAMSGCEFVENISRGLSESGGAIYLARSKATITFTGDCAFRDNDPEGNAGNGIHSGGGNLNPSDALIYPEYIKEFLPKAAPESGEPTVDLTKYPADFLVLRETPVYATAELGGAPIGKLSPWSSVEVLEYRKELKAFRIRYGNRVGFVPASALRHGLLVGGN